MEVEIGATTLVAESLRATQLRDFCRRLLGWGADRLRAVDHALRAIRLARSGYTSLVLYGEGDLVPIAHALHRHTLGDAAPFIVSDRRRLNTRASVRAPANLPSGMEALTAAAGGTLCLRTSRLPHDLNEVMSRLYEPGSGVQLFLCADSDRRHMAPAGAQPIQMPPLHIREKELPRIIQEFAQDAIAFLGAPPTSFTDEDRRWVMRNSARSLFEIQKGTLRIVAVRISKNVSQAAALLGMATVSLSRWLGRRGDLISTARGHQRVQPKTSRASSLRLRAETV